MSLRIPRMARWLGLLIVLGAWLVMAWLPLRPDGDATAQALFDARYPASVWHSVRGSMGYRIGLAVLFWGALDSVVGMGAAVPRLPRGMRRVAWLGVLLACVGLMWDSRSGWAGEWFLEPNRPVLLRDDGPRLTFERFLVPPAPDGAGRALEMVLRLDQRPTTASAMQPYRAGALTFTPRWYGATVEGDALTAPLFFGSSGSQTTTLRNGQALTVTVDIESLAVTTTPAIDGVVAHHHAIVGTRHAPGEPLVYAGLAVCAVASSITLTLWADSRRRAARV